MNPIRLPFICAAFILAANAVYADSCQSLLCMAGKLQGQTGGSNCDQPVADYFSIVEFGKHGSFDPGKTATARMDYLNSCSAPGVGSWPSQINAAYGTVRN